MNPANFPEPGQLSFEGMLPGGVPTFIAAAASVVLIILMIVLIRTIRRKVRQVVHAQNATNSLLTALVAADDRLIRELTISRKQAHKDTQPMLSIQRQLATIDFRMRPEVRSRITYLAAERVSVRKACQPIYSLNLLSKSIQTELSVDNGIGSPILFSVAVGKEYQNIVRPCLQTHEQFAMIHGYSRAIMDTVPSHRPLRHAAWMKVPGICKLMSMSYPYIIHIDADAMITNLAKSFESEIERLADTGAGILLCEDEEGVNTGVMVIRNCPEAAVLMDLIWSYDADLENSTWEQNSLNFLFDNFLEVRNHILVEDNPKSLHSFPLERSLTFESRPQNIWSRGDRVCHFSGIRQPHLQSFINRYARSLGVAEPSQKTNAASARPLRHAPDATVTFSKLGEHGQFGNQLFQIAATLGYAARHGARPMLPRWRCRVAQRDYDNEFPAIRRYYGNPPASTLYKEPSFAFAPVPFMKHVDLEGNFQSEDYFVHIKDEVVSLFAEPEAIKSELEAFCASERLTRFDAIHFRTYSHPDRDNGVMTKLPDEYFKAALELLSGDRPLVIATDDKPAAGPFIERASAGRRVIPLTFPDPLRDFYMLSRASRIAISNSSFSWWAAYLGPEKEAIIAPHRYFWFGPNDRKNPFWDPRDLYPDKFHELIL